MSAVGRRVCPFPAGTRTPRGPTDPPKVKKFTKSGLKLRERVEFEPTSLRSKGETHTNVLQCQLKIKYEY